MIRPPRLVPRGAVVAGLRHRAVPLEELPRADPLSIVSAARAIPSVTGWAAPGRHERRAGVEEDHVASRVAVALEDRDRQHGVLVGRPAAQVARRRRAQADRPRIDRRFAGCRRRSRRGSRPSRRGEARRRRRRRRPAFARSRGSRATSAIRGATLASPTPMRARRRAGRVRQRPDEVERRPDADLAAGRPGVAHRRVEARREQERETEAPEVDRRPTRRRDRPGPRGPRGRRPRRTAR